MHKETPAEDKPVAALPNLSPSGVAELAPRSVAEKPAVKGTFGVEALFEFDMAAIRPEGRKARDEDIVAGINSHPETELLTGTGHADHVGTEAYNQSSSERRANAVRHYLIKQHAAAERIRAVSEPDPHANTGVACRGLGGSTLIACLQPDRRVTVVLQRPAAD